MKKTILLLIAMLIVTVSCQPAPTSVPPTPTPLPPGSVVGKLFDANGKPSPDIQLILIKVTDQNGDKVNGVTTKFQVHTDKKGGFAFDKVENGKYAIFYIDAISSLQGQDTMIRSKDSKLVVFEVLESKGIDLGDLAMNK